MTPPLRLPLKQVWQPFEETLPLSAVFTNLLFDLVQPFKDFLLNLWLWRLIHRWRRWLMLVPISRVTSSPWPSIWSFRMKGIVIPSYLVRIYLRITVVVVVVGVRRLLEWVVCCWPAYAGIGLSKPKGGTTGTELTSGMGLDGPPS